MRDRFRVPGQLKTGPKRGLAEQTKRGDREVLPTTRKRRRTRTPQGQRGREGRRRNRKTILLKPIGIVEDDRMDEDGK